MFNYITYRVFNHFKKRDNEESAAFSTILFLGIFQVSLLMPVFIIVNLFFEIDLKEILGEDENIKYYIGIPMMGLSYVISNSIFKKKIKGQQYEELKKKYHKDKYIIPIVVIILSPFFFTLVVPIIYGALNGTLRIGY